MNIKAFYWLALSFFGYYCAYGVFMPFFPVWLKSQSYGEEMIGLVVASAYVFRFLGGIFFSSLVKKVSLLVNALRYLAWASCGLMLIIGLLAENFWLLFIAIAIFSMCNAAGMPISDSLATTWQQQIQLDYGKARLIGSGAFVVGVTVFGYVIGVVGEQYIIWIIAALLLVYALLQMNSPFPMPQDEAESAVKNSVGFTTLLKNRTTLRLLLAISLIQGSHAAYYAYSVLYWTGMGFSVSQTSLLWGIGVLAEILIFFFSTKLFKHWTISTLFYLCGVSAVIRWLGISAADSLWEIALLQTFHGLTYAAGHYAIVRYITTQPQQHIAKLQALYNGFAGCAAVALLTGLSGVLYPIAPTYAFFAMTISALLGLLAVPPKVQAFLVKRVVQ